jgi:hypothetical protein
VSREAGYVAYYPPAWHILTPKLPTLLIVNFPPSRAVKADIIPEGGAMIAVVPPPRWIHSLEPWIKYRLKASRVLSNTTTTLRPGDFRGALQITEVTYQWGLPGAETDNVDVYFDAAGKLLVAGLSYWKGDPKAKSYVEALQRMVGAIRPMKQEE